MKNRFILFCVALCLVLNTAQMVYAEELPLDPPPLAETTEAAEPAPDASGTITNDQPELNQVSSPESGYDQTDVTGDNADVAGSQPVIDENASPPEENETIEAQAGLFGGTEGNDTAVAQPDTSDVIGDSLAIDANDIPLSGEIVTDAAIETDGIAGASAQGSSQKASISLAPSSVNLGSSVSGQAIIITNAVTLTVTSQKNLWNITMSAGNFTSGSSTIPPGRISVKLSTSNTWIPLTSAQTTLLSNQPATNGININLDYKLQLLPTDPIGLNYAGSITYTIIPI